MIGGTPELAVQIRESIQRFEFLSVAFRTTITAH